MNFSEQWLREWVNSPISSADLLQQLTMSGLEVESHTPVAGQFTNVVVGSIIQVDPHPQADKLRVCQVSISNDKKLQIVTAASNVKPEMKVAVALVGATLTDGKTIEKTTLRGVDSEGMLCSTLELDMTDTAEEGIWELPTDAPLGQSIHDWLKLDDQSIQLKLTPNRGDCLSVVGVAREVAVMSRMNLKAMNVHPIAASIQDKFPIEVSAPADCPRYIGRIIRGVNAKATTPIWLQEKLRRSGLHSINAIVDIANYLMLEYGQPLHTFDLEQLENGIKIRRALENEKITLLDGREVNLNSETLVIADANKPVAIAGIMGSENSGVTADTQDIFLESAFFTPTSIAGRARQYGLSTDASHRFERGVDPNLALQISELATQLILEIAGGQAGPVIEVSNQTSLPTSAAIKLRRERVSRLLGISIPDKEIEDILQRLGMTIKTLENGWEITAPSYRFDLSIEEDLIEEIARIYGYQRIPDQMPNVAMQFPMLSESEISISRFTHALVDRDYHEAITYSFISPELQKSFDPSAVSLALVNPISADLSQMRTSLWPGLISAILYNLNRQQERVRLFELGLKYIFTPNGLEQRPVLSGAAIGSASEEQWGIKRKPMDFFDLKGDVQALLSLNGKVEEFVFLPVEHPALHPSQSSQIIKGNQVMGLLGTIHPELEQKLGLNSPVYLFELDVNLLKNKAISKFEAISKFPSIRRDIAFIVAKKVNNAEIHKVIRNKAGDLLKNLQLFDVYQGQSIDPTQKSIAVGLTLQHPSRTLIDNEVADLVDRVGLALKEEFAVIMRE